MGMMHERVAHMDPDDIIDMDQMPIIYLYHAKQKLEKRADIEKLNFEKK